MKRNFSRGLVLAETLVVLSVMAGLLSIAVPAYQGARQKAVESACSSTRSAASHAVTLYVTDHPDDPPSSLGQVAAAGYMQAAPSCPGGGELMLIPPEESGGIPQVGCSLHHWLGKDAQGTVEEPEPLTSLGSTLAEISGGMIARIQSYCDENGHYPRSWGDYAYTDIGLDPEEWKNEFNGIVYSPGGSRVKLTPGEDRTFYVTDAKGNERVLKDSYNWSLWYSVKKGNWYFHSVGKGNEIDISTLRVE